MGHTLQEPHGPGRLEPLLDHWEAAERIDWIWLVWATVLFRGEAREEEAAGLLWTREAVAGDGQRS